MVSADAAVVTEAAVEVDEEPQGAVVVAVVAVVEKPVLVVVPKSLW